MSPGQHEEELTGEGGPARRGAELSLLVLLDGGTVVHALPAAGRVTIGRARDGDVVVPHASVSRQHAVLDVDAMTIVDLGSRNGTSVRGERVLAQIATAVRPGDPVAVGDVTLIVQRTAASVGGRRALAPVPAEQPLELRLGEEAARSARHGAPFVHARVHVASDRADLAREVLAETLRGSDVFVEDGPGCFQLLLPATDVDHGRAVVQRLVATLARHDIAARTGLAAYPFDGINAAQLSARARELVAAAPGRQRTAMDEVRRQVASVAAGDLTVLITGETGVGKELFAEMVHRTSPRAQRPFLRLNCASIAEPLLESELFGHARGAYTGADIARVGLVEAADGGTLFLDEIGEMALRLQATLLRVLEEKVVRRVGESESRPVDVRIVCATNRALLQEVEAQRFRRDLYYRISGVTLALPPLRERGDELEGIVRAFTALATIRTGRAAPVFTDEALRALRAHAWPGNIRELRNAIERAVLLAGDGPIRAAELGLAAVAAAAAADREWSEGHLTLPPGALDRRGLSNEIADLERRRIVEALEAYGGNQTRAARALGLSRNTLLARLDEYGLRRPRK